MLDEPTNHLDAESREALEAALEAYDGTVLMVSHDRALIDAIATHTLAIEDGRAVLRAGGYTDLLRAREEPPAPRRAPAPRAAPRHAARCRASPGLRRPAPRCGAWRGASPRSRPRSPTSRRTSPTRGCWATASCLAARGEEHRALQEELVWLMREWEQAAEAAS